VIRSGWERFDVDGQLNYRKPPKGWILHAYSHISRIGFNLFLGYDNLLQKKCHNGRKQAYTLNT
jgi:hypothetical protein